MLERLGPNVWHETPAAAMAVLEELEETAKLWLWSARRWSADRKPWARPRSMNCAAASAPAGKRSAMPRFAANLSMLYPELDFLRRFEVTLVDAYIDAAAGGPLYGGRRYLV
jgi:hypothetical protein